MTTPGGDALEETARRRLRTLRQARGWTLDDLAERAHIGASTISRIETGQRRLAVDQLVTLARALGISVDDVLADDDADDIVIRPQPCGDGGAVWLLSRRDDPSGRVVAKQRVPEGTERDPERHVHPGHDWFFVLTGTVRLVLGGPGARGRRGRGRGVRHPHAAQRRRHRRPGGDPDDPRPPRRALPPRRRLTTLPEQQDVLPTAAMRSMLVP